MKTILTFKLNSKLVSRIHGRHSEIIRLVYPPNCKRRICGFLFPFNAGVNHSHSHFN